MGPLSDGGGAVNRSEWAARGFSDPIAGYGRLKIHKTRPGRPSDSPIHLNPRTTVNPRLVRVVYS